MTMPLEGIIKYQTNMKKVSHHLAVTALAIIVSLTTTVAFAGPPGKQGAPAKKEVAKPYPLTTCIVSDDKLGEMGKPVVFDYKGQEVKLCCKDCRKDFDKDPAKYLKKLSDKK